MNQKINSAITRLATSSDRSTTSAFTSSSLADFEDTGHVFAAVSAALHDSLAKRGTNEKKPGANACAFSASYPTPCIHDGHGEARDRDSLSQHAAAKYDFRAFSLPLASIQKNDRKTTFLSLNSPCQAELLKNDIAKNLVRQPIPQQSSEFDPRRQFSNDGTSFVVTTADAGNKVTDGTFSAVTSSCSFFPLQQEMTRPAQQKQHDIPFDDIKFHILLKPG